MSVFTINKKSHLTRRMFFDGGVDIQRFDVMKYPIFYKLTDQLDGFRWRAIDVDCSKDGKDFKTVTPGEQHIVTSNIKRQILLDTVQGRAPMSVLGPLTSLPEVEAWLVAWTDSERVHSQTYTHIIRGVYPNPSPIFDSVLDIPEIVECAADISKYYDALANFAGAYGSYEHKKRLWMCINSINALEGIRFYVSFACTWAFAEQKKMMGNATLIKYIARDENIHLASTQQMLKILPQDDNDFEKIKKECEPAVTALFVSVANQEIRWAEFLFEKGSMIGLNAPLLKHYIEWLANKRMVAIGVPTPFSNGTNPLPWTQKWISGADVQPANQETESTQYIQGVNRTTQSDTFANFEL